MSGQLRLSLFGAIATMTATLSLWSVFSSPGWIAPVMVSVALVAGLCALVRRSRLPSAFEPLVAAVGVLLWLTLLYAHGEAYLGLVPGRAALQRLGDVARAGFTEIHDVPAPAAPHHGLVMLTVVGVAAVALLVDLLTVTLRRAALSGLPLLALFTVAAATGRHGVAILPFVVGGVGYLWLLHVDNREKVARWGTAVGSGDRAQPASAASSDPAAAAGSGALGRRVGATALALGVVVPVIIPGLRTDITRHGSGSGRSGQGSGNVQTFDPIVKVSSDLTASQTTPVLTYRTSTADPGYLRLTSLDRFNGSSFTAEALTAPSTATVSDNLPVTPPIGPTVTSTIDMAAGAEFRWLPAPATVVGVSVGDAWRYDPASQTIFSATATTQGLHYTARSVAEAPPRAQLAQSGRPTSNLADLAVPRQVAQELRPLATTIAGGAASRYAAAVAIQHYLTSNRFVYDVHIKPDTSPDALANFLLRTRRGFCQQYATAMAVLARLSGIPSRVAVGFTRGRQLPDGRWLVTTRDAHAWPELWFQHVGWLAFEPTPRRDGQAVTPDYTTPAAAAAAGGATPHHRRSSSPRTRGDELPAGVNRKNLPGKLAGGQPARSGGGHSSAGGVARTVLWVLLALAGLLLVTLPATREVTRRRRLARLGGPDAAAAAWAELRDLSLDLGFGWDDERSPRQLAGMLAADLVAGREARAAITHLAQCEEESRYARTPTTPCHGLRDDLAAVRAGALTRITRAQRLRALTVPHSTVQRAAATRYALAERTRAWRRRSTAALATLPTVLEPLHHRAPRA